jgi:hypothetical protein
MRALTTLYQAMSYSFFGKVRKLGSIFIAKLQANGGDTAAQTAPAILIDEPERRFDYFGR